MDLSERFARASRGAKGRGRSVPPFRGHVRIASSGRTLFSQALRRGVGHGYFWLSWSDRGGHGGMYRGLRSQERVATPRHHWIEGRGDHVWRAERLSITL